MTAYKNFVVDFPSRCRDVLELAGEPALFSGREVTLTLIVASSGLLVPYERLKPDGDIPHPSKDNKTFSVAANQLKSLLAEKFLSSAVWAKPGSSTWHFGERLSVKEDPDSWVHELKPFTKDKTVGGIFRVIRNALAHGNIFTSKDPIEEIIFYAANLNNEKKVQNYSVVSVGRVDFRRFLERWFEFLESLRIPRNEVFEVLTYAV